MICFELVQRRDKFILHTRKIDESTYGGNEQWPNKPFQQLRLDSDEEKGETGQKRTIIWSGD